MWALVPVIRLEICASRVTRNNHGCWDAKARVVDLHDPRFVHSHTDYSIVANAAVGSEELIDNWVAPYGEGCVGRVEVVQTNEDGLCSNPPAPRFTRDGRETVERMRHSVIPEPSWSKISA